MSPFEMTLFAIVMLHLLLGFGYVMYKLRGRPKKDMQQE